MTTFLDEIQQGRFDRFLETMASIYTTTGFINISDNYVVHLQKTHYTFRINGEQIDFDELIKAIITHDRQDIVDLLIGRYIIQYHMKQVFYFRVLEEAILQHNVVFKRIAMTYLIQVDLRSHKFSMNAIWSKHMSPDLFIEMVSALLELNNRNPYAILSSIHTHFNDHLVDVGLYDTPIWFADARAREVYDQLFQESTINLHKEYCDYKVQQKHTEGLKPIVQMVLESKVPRDLVHFEIIPYL